MKKINVCSALALATIMTACSRQSEETNLNSDTNSVSTVSTNEASLTASNAWQNTRQTGTNLWDQTKGLATNAWENTKEAGSNAWQSTKEAFGAGGPTNGVSTNYFGYDYSMKDAFVSEAKTSMDNLDQNAAALSNRLASASNDVQAGLQQDLQDVQTKRAELGKEYADIQNATQSNWDDTKTAFVKSYHDLKADLKAGWDSVTSKM